MESIFGGADKQPEKKESDGGKFIAITEDQNLHTTEAEAEATSKTQKEKLFLEQAVTEIEKDLENHPLKAKLDDYRERLRNLQ